MEKILQKKQQKKKPQQPSTKLWNTQQIKFSEDCDPKRHVWGVLLYIVFLVRVGRSWETLDVYFYLDFIEWVWNPEPATLLL